MLILKLPLILFALVSTIQISQAETFYHDASRGWHWYESMPLPHEEDNNEDKEKDGEGEKASVKPKKPKTPKEVIAAYREELENRLAQAWIDPTPQNVGAYQVMQEDMMDRSQKFSKTWMKNIFLNPELDHTLVSPVNQQARHVYYDKQKHQVFETIQGLSKSYGLFFFFSSNCPYCHQFAPIVKQFAEQYGWDVLAISLDGGGIDLFPDALPDTHGLAQAWGVQALPSLFAVNPTTEHVIPVAHGMTAMDQMETRIMALVE